MQLLVGKFCKSRGSECKGAWCLQLCLGPPHSTGKLVQEDFCRRRRRKGCQNSTDARSSFFLCLRLHQLLRSWKIQQKAEQTTALGLENLVILFSSSLHHRVYPGGCLGLILSGCLHCTLFFLMQDVLLQFGACMLLHVTQKHAQVSWIVGFLSCLPSLHELSEQLLAGAKGWCWCPVRMLGCQAGSSQVESAGVPWLCSRCTWLAGGCCWVTWYGNDEGRGHVLPVALLQVRKMFFLREALSGLQLFRCMSGRLNGECDFKHMAREWVACYSASPVCRSTVKDCPDICHTWGHLWLRNPHAILQVSYDILVIKVLCCFNI